MSSNFSFQNAPNVSLQKTTMKIQRRKMKKNGRWMTLYLLMTWKHSLSEESSRLMAFSLLSNSQAQLQIRVPLPKMLLPIKSRKTQMRSMMKPYPSFRTADCWGKMNCRFVYVWISNLELWSENGKICRKIFTVCSGIWKPGRSSDNNPLITKMRNKITQNRRFSGFYA